MIVLTMLVIVSFLLTEDMTNKITGFAVLTGKEITQKDFEKARTRLEIPDQDVQISLSKLYLSLNKGDEGVVIVRFLNPANSGIRTLLKIEGKEDFFTYYREEKSVRVNEFLDWDVKIKIPEDAKSKDYGYRIFVGGREAFLIINVK